MLTFILGIIAGLVIYPIARACIHKHDYEVLFHRNAVKAGIGYQWYSSGDEPGNVIATYKKCKHCGDVVVYLGNGSARQLIYNDEYVKDKIELTLKIEKEAENKRLLESMDSRISSKDAEWIARGNDDATTEANHYNKASA